MKSGWHNVEVVVIVAGTRWDQHLKAAFDGQAWCDDEDVLGEAFVLWIRHFVANLPGREHRHHDRLAGAGGHLAAPPNEWPAVTRDIHSNQICRRALGEPDERLDSLEL